jgi:Protein of unknown function (DUF4232)
MKHFSSTVGRRVTAVIAAACLAGLAITGAAFAATSSGAAHGTPAAVPRCTAAQLGTWLAIDQGNGAAGTIFYPLQFTNLSKHACTMRGFPGVSVLDRHGRQLGAPASRDHVAPVRTVLLAPGATAHAILGWTDAFITSSPGCHPVFSAFELRIFPPDQRAATHALFDLEACSKAGASYLGIGPIVPGPGTING